MKKAILFVSLLLLSLPLLSATTTDKKIKKSEKSLNKSVKEHKEMSGQLDKIAKNIKNANSDNRALNKKLEVLSQEFSKNEKAYQSSKKSLAEYDKNLNLINRKIKEENKKFIEVLANQSSVIHAMNQSHDPSRESIVMQEAYRLLKKQNTKELAELKQQIDRNKVQKRKITRKRSSVKKKIDKIAKQRKEYKEQKSAKKKLLKKLSANEGKYRQKLQKEMDRQNELRSALAELNILQKKEVEEERRIAAEQKAAMLAEEKRKQDERIKREQARSEARKKGKKVVYTSKVKETPVNRSVKKVGSSYKKDKIYAYRGKKTISPIRGAKLVKKFGTYVDPVYKIKIFNESITLRAPSSNAKVQNILNGKVVFAGSSSMLGKVVIVSHSGKVHTIYAGLSKIAPTIHKGSKIKKGYVIGKVSRKLIFEATKNSKHINPMRLISL
ncbi:MAG: peptidoglycan DD-metalloendopeptidase family protein [Campylobacterota bacterium]|nr:peptidoglycan DD-metalloendopeptidase family protein [Campylobacterota bacterium]